jgi:hypothetical protein
MAEQQGGMRRPQNPAPVSGPGRLSQRTDGGPQQVQAEMSGMPYGENQEFEAIQASAPMGASGQAAARANRRGGSGRSTQRAAGQVGLTPLMSPTQRPDEPITTGAPFGPGDGPTPYPGMNTINKNDARALGKYLPSMMRMAENPDTPDGFKRFVRHLRNMQAGM